MSTSRFARHFSIRDKHRSHSKNRDDDPISYGLFMPREGSKKPSKDEEKKMQELSQQLVSIGLTDIPDSRIEYAIRAKSTEGDPKKALQLLMLFEDSVGGILKPYDPNIKMMGAENREKVTCYLDALLFAMFAKVDVFEALLFHNFEDEPRKRLINVLRLWVNLLRTGRIITTDVTQHLQDCLSACGWDDAAHIRQQDASEAFGFITDQLELPLVTLKTDLFHAGKAEDNDDHKFITERLLDVAIPEKPPPGGVVSLESCLEEYFNNRVEIRRELQRRTTNASLTKFDSMEKSGASHIETSELDSASNSPVAPEFPIDVQSRPRISRLRAPSIFSERKDEVSDIDKTRGPKVAPINGETRRKNSVKKEVLMPAWQFLNLIPWYTDNTTDGDGQAAAHFASRRPMLGICLKRYTMSKNGVASRLSTHVDIPLEMVPPHFAVDSEGEDATASNFKLSLQSVVCHRGASVNAGHYIAFVRTPPIATERSDGLVQERDHGWLQMDDLAAERVSVVDIHKVLKEESPYLLFYRIQPIEEYQSEDDLPPYSESGDTLASVDQKLASVAEARRSLEVPDRSSRRTSTIERASLDVPRQSSIITDTRRSSVLLQDSASSLVVPEQVMSDPSSPQEALTRHSTNSKSNRPASDTSDKRFMSKLTAKLGRDKLASTEIAVDEVTDLDAPMVKDLSNDSQMKTKGNHRRGMLGMSRRGSRGRNKEPDRECSLM